jgi:hypothetical protein
MTHKPISPLEIALVAAPGLLITLATAFAGMPIELFLGAIVALGLTALALAVARQSPDAFPVWGILPLGLLTFLFTNWLAMPDIPGVWVVLAVAGVAIPLAVLGMVLWRERPGRPPPASGWLLVVALVAAVLTVMSAGGYPFYSSPADWTFLALPVAMGLLLAPVYGLRAVWLLLPAGTFLMSFDIEHVIYFWDAPGWSDAIKTAMPVLFLIVTPVWMAATRDRRLQTAGLVVPPGALLVVPGHRAGDRLVRRTRLGACIPHRPAGVRPDRRPGFLRCDLRLAGAGERDLTREYLSGLSHVETRHSYSIPIDQGTCQVWDSGHPGYHSSPLPGCEPSATERPKLSNFDLLLAPHRNPLQRASHHPVDLKLVDRPRPPVEADGQHAGDEKGQRWISRPT